MWPLFVAGKQGGKVKTENYQKAGQALMRIAAMKAARRQCVIQYNLCGYNEHAAFWHALLTSFDDAIANLERDVARYSGGERFIWRDLDG